MDETIVCCDGLEIALKHWNRKQSGSQRHDHDSSSSSTRSTRASQYYVLCLHGFLDNCESFHFIGPYLAKDSNNYEVVALDLPGHGLSGHHSGDGPIHTLPEVTFYIKEVVDHLKWSSHGFSLVGHSSGAAIACLYTAMYPQEVDRLVLLEGLGPRAIPDENVAHQARLHIENRHVANLGLFAQHTHSREGRVFESLDDAVSFRQKAARTAPGEQHISKRAAAAIVQRSTVQINVLANNPNPNNGKCQSVQVRERCDERLQLPYIHYFTPEQVDTIYRLLDCPICILVAEDGLPMKHLLDRTLSMLEKQPSVVLETLPGSHHFHADPSTAEDVCKVISTFLRRETFHPTEEMKGKIRGRLSSRCLLTRVNEKAGTNSTAGITQAVDTMDTEPHNYLSGSDDRPTGKQPPRDDSHKTNNGCSRQWAKNVQAIRDPFIDIIRAASRTAATHPKATIALTLLISFALAGIGLATNFYLEDDEIKLWTPEDSKSFEQGQWVETGEAGYALNRPVILLVHTDGKENVLNREGMSRVFTVLDGIRNLEGYDDLCSLSNPSDTYIDTSGNRTCLIVGATQFWEHDSSLFEEEVGSQEEFIEDISNTTYPNGVPVERQFVIGLAETDNDEYNGTLTYAASYRVVVIFPDGVDLAEIVEGRIIEFVLNLEKKWQTEEDSPYRIEIFAKRSFGDEFRRAIMKDMPLVPGVFVLMSCFCCIVFSQRDIVHSQALLGLGAVASVACALASAFGILFISGVPFTALTQVLPFIVFGIGLDDAFIIMGSYARTDPNKDPVSRIDETICDCGGSILITSLTSTIAFGLGAISTIPAVRWLCLYAFPAIIIDFVYQVTFFIALVVVDDKRIKDRRMDCCVCFHAPGRPRDDDDPVVNNGEQLAPLEHQPRNFSHRFMSAYANILLKPMIAYLVVLFFAAFLVFATFKAMSLKQAFDFLDILPTDSYIADYVQSVDDYSDAELIIPNVYFREVDFSDLATQNAMFDYVDDLVELDEVVGQPTFFWLRDFHYFLSVVPYFQVRPFREQLDGFLNISVFDAIHTRNIVRNEGGDMLTSRTSIFFNIDDMSVTAQMNALDAQSSVSASQPVNQGKTYWKFFAHARVFYLWEFFSVAESELVVTTVIGVVSVCIIAALFIPHWTAIFFIGPMVCMLYVELLGIYQMIGLHVNSVTYVSIVMSIGLMVDYLMHVVIRYYESKEESRREKTRFTLETMGVSILVGGLTTLLGIIAMAFASSNIFDTLFKAFCSLVVLGITSGLILLPAILSLVGPEGQTHHPHTSTVATNIKQSSG